MKDVLQVLSTLSTKINMNINHVKNKSASELEFQSKVAGYYSNAAIEVINADFSNDKKAVNLYRDFYLSTLENLNTKLVDSPDLVRLKYISMQDVVSVNYLVVSYLIRNDDIETAAMLSALTVESIMDDHNVPRAVLTMSARNGVPSPYRGWFIGKAIDICDQSEIWASLFFHNKKEVTKYLCQADFIQYVLEFSKNNDVYDGYPNFLFYPKSNITPLIHKLSAYNEYDHLDFESILTRVTEINSGEFFNGNAWRR